MKNIVEIVPIKYQQQRRERFYFAYNLISPQNNNKTAKTQTHNLTKGHLVSTSIVLFCSVTKLQNTMMQSITNSVMKLQVEQKTSNTRKKSETTTLLHMTNVWWIVRGVAFVFRL